MPRTPKFEEEKKTDKDKEKEEKERNGKKTELARAQNKKAQEKDMPRFKQGENQIDTATETYEVNGGKNLEVEPETATQNFG